MNFRGLNAFGEFIMRTLLRDMPHARHNALEQAGQILEDAVKAKIGEYQPGWPPLSPSTIERKGQDTPLLETGELRESIHHIVIDTPNGGDVYVGSDNDKALWHELGTRHIPPRPFLQPTAMEMEDKLVAMIGGRVAAFLRTGEVREISNAEYDRHADVHYGYEGE